MQLYQGIVHLGNSPWLTVVFLLNEELQNNGFQQGFVLVSSMSEAICQASAHTESVVGYGRLGRLRAGTNVIYSPDL